MNFLSSLLGESRINPFILKPKGPLLAGCGPIVATAFDPKQTSSVTDIPGIDFPKCTVRVTAINEVMVIFPADGIDRSSRIVHRFLVCVF
jgi:hypothetical protein